MKGHPPRLPVAPSHEQATVKAILQLLHLNRIPSWRINTGGAKIGDRFVRFGMVGMSDIVGILPSGRFLAIEVKSATGKVTRPQQAFLDTVNAHGGYGFVARSVEYVRLALGLP